MQRKLLGIISVDFDTTGQLLIVYSAFVKYRREVLYKILIALGTPMKPVRLIKMCWNETYSRVQVGKHLSDVSAIRNGLKQEDTLLSLLFNFAVRRVQVNQDGLKLNGTHQLLVYADYIIHCRIFHLPVCYPKIQRLRDIELYFCLLLCRGVKLGHSH